MRAILIVLAILAGCDSKPQQPSKQCQEVWYLRNLMQSGEYPPTSLDDLLKQRRILEHAEWCDRNPGGIWL